MPLFCTVKAELIRFELRSLCLISNGHLPKLTLHCGQFLQLFRSAIFSYFTTHGIPLTMAIAISLVFTNDHTHKTSN